MNIWKFIRSFGHGTRGLWHAVGHEQNMRVHFLAAVVAAAAGCYFGISAGEWLAIAVCIGSVIAFECVNTAVERLADRITSEVDPAIKQAKDTAAAAVFVAALTSIVVAGIVFLPKIVALMGFTFLG
jgi:diacylglycerol kinase